MKDILADVPMILPEDVADAIVYALGTRPEVQVGIRIMRGQYSTSSKYLKFFR